VNIKLIELYDIQYWNTTTNNWKSLYVCDDSEIATSVGPGSQKSIVLYDAGAGSGYNPTNPFTHTMDWRWLTVNDGSGITEGWTAFDPNAVGDPMIKADAVSVKLRYKLRVTDMSDPANIYEPPQIYYQIIMAAHPADHISFGSGGTTGPWAPEITVGLPGISNAMVANSAALFGWLTTPANWLIVWTRPDGTTRTLGPVTNPTLTTAVSATTEYQGAVANILLRLPTLQIGQSGSHKLTVSLLPNAQQSGGFHEFDDDHTWTATITALTPSIGDPLYLSFDNNTFMTIEFAH
jgi:hypothetical protein